jgi:hypothetical protein
MSWSVAISICCAAVWVVWILPKLGRLLIPPLITWLVRQLMNRYLHLGAVKPAVFSGDTAFAFWHNERAVPVVLDPKYAVQNAKDLELRVMRGDLVVKGVLLAHTDSATAIAEG